MFNIDRAIATWRQQMAGGGLRQPEILDELEGHLRDEFESRLSSGSDAQQAFGLAVKRIGRPDALRHEFANSSPWLDHLKDAFLTLAGIPNQNFATNMNTSHIEPAWATYLKATAFLVPAMFLATLSAIFVVPKLQQICRDVQMPTTDGAFWALTHSSISVMLTLREHGVMIAFGAIVLLVLLEFRFAGWPRYRRAAIGFGAFLLNSIVLLAFFMMFIAAILAAPALGHSK